MNLALNNIVHIFGHVAAKHVRIHAQDLSDD